MDEAEKLFQKHWLKKTGKPLDEATKFHMRYAIDAIDEALQINGNYVVFEYSQEQDGLVQLSVPLPTLGKAIEYVKSWKNKKLYIYRECKNFEK